LNSGADDPSGIIAYPAKNSYDHDAHDKEPLGYLRWQWHERRMINWLVKNVLEPLAKMPKPATQITQLEPPPAYPAELLGPVFTFVRSEDADRVQALIDNPAKADVDERYACNGGWRLFSLGTPARGIGDVAYAGYVWCAPGTPVPPEKGDWWIGKDVRWSMGGEKKVMGVLPKSGHQIFVVDWAVWGELAYDGVGIKSAQDEEKARQTLVPVSEYKGGFKEPLVLIGRPVEIDEVLGFYDADLKLLPAPTATTAGASETKH
jgi:hypothetical protein